MILGVTPARGGSKGIPQKNIRSICGKPLIAWTIESALESRLIDEYVVSTDDPEIAEITREYGAKVLPRPNNLATDEATTLSVLQHVLDYYEPEILVLLQCTSPVRYSGLIDECINKYIDKKADSLATGFMCDLFEWRSYGARRQELNSFFHDDGNVYVLSPDDLRKGRMWGERCINHVIDRKYSFEIDDEFDFWINEKILDELMQQ